MLRRIGLQNFKCWRELDIELAPITLFFGVNSSGKTAILESLLMLKQTARGFDPGQHINFGGTDRDYIDLGSYRDVVSEHDEKKRIGMQMLWNTDTTIFFVSDKLEDNSRSLKSMTYDVTWGVDEHVSISRLRYDVESEESPSDWVKVWREDAGSYLLTSSFAEPADIPDKVESPKSCYVLPWTAHYGAEKKHFVSLMNVSGEFEHIVERFHPIGSLRLKPERYYPRTGGKPETIGPDGANTIQALIASASEGRYLLDHTALLLQDLELVEEFDVKQIDTNGRLYEATATIGGIESSLVDVGFGVSQVLPVIMMLLMAPRNSIILLEQPELHLHPNAQAALADLLLYVAEKRNLQLIVESHSEHIVRRLQRRIAEAAPAFATPENVKMYYCQPGQAGSTIEQVDLDRFGQISNWPERFFGDVSGDLHAMVKSALERRSQELESVGSGG